MEISVNDVIQARDIVADMLNELKIDTNLFNIEPVDAQWELQIECASNDGWKMIHLNLAKKMLLECASNPAIRTNILNKLRTELSSCNHS